ncbi:MAG: hypothetical protein H8D67_21480 [Deltaproteobacteria bacterium]|nr:hypothetical protein [Deltaproteobacteria bacterium]
MISQNDIERKDFSICLPRIIAKINFMACAIGNCRHVEFCGLFDSPGDFEAVGDILTEAADDLAKINKTLYPDLAEEGGAS